MKNILFWWVSNLTDTRRSWFISLWYQHTLDTTWRISLRISLCASREADSGTASIQEPPGWGWVPVIHTDALIKNWNWEQKMIFSLTLCANTFFLLQESARTALMVKWCASFWWWYSLHCQDVYLKAMDIWSDDVMRGGESTNEVIVQQEMTLHVTLAPSRWSWMSKCLWAGTSQCSLAVRLGSSEHPMLGLLGAADVSYTAPLQGGQLIIS